MENKINIADLLRDCPKGMELDCTMYDGVEFMEVDTESDTIILQVGNKFIRRLNKYGQEDNIDYAKCVIFPKGKTTWEGFHRPFRDGDIITCNNSACTFVSIFKDKPTERSFRKHCSFILDCNSFVVATHFADYTNPRFATEEERQKLFQAIEDNGYHWNAETKTLEKLSKFKDGDVVATTTGCWIGITTGGKKNCFIPTYCVIKDDGKFEAYFDRKGEWEFSRLATEEEKEKLFQKIKEAGYKWNPETKTLEKLVEPKFKVGDKIKHIVGRKEIATVVGVKELHYILDSKVGTSSFSISLQREWELVPNKFDITTLKPFESRVLVRNDDGREWVPTFWGYYREHATYRYATTAGIYYYCIPYKGNEYLCGKRNDCDDFYKTWEK